MFFYTRMKARYFYLLFEAASCQMRIAVNKFNLIQFARRCCSISMYCRSQVRQNLKLQFLNIPIRYAHKGFGDITNKNSILSDLEFEFL